jgi:hypothetical protein
VKLTKEQSELIFGKLFKDTGFEPSTRSRLSGQRIILKTCGLDLQWRLIKWAQENLPLNVQVALLAYDKDDQSDSGRYIVTNLTPCDGMPVFKVDYDNGESQVTSMAEGTTYDAAYNYYVGKSFTYERPNGEEYLLKCVRITQIG